MGARPVSFEIGPVTGTGRNMTMAREDAIQKAADALGGLWPVPFLFTWRDTTIMVWRDAAGYVWKNFDAGGNLDDPQGYRQPESPTFAEAIDCAKRHLACLRWCPEDGATPPDWCEGALRDSVARSFLSYARHHEAVHVHGLDAEGATDYAGCNPGRSEVWKGRPTKYPLPDYPTEWFPPPCVESASL